MGVPGRKVDVMSELMILNLRQQRLLARHRNCVKESMYSDPV